MRGLLDVVATTSSLALIIVMITAYYHPLIAQSTYEIDNTGHFSTYASLPRRLLCELYTVWICYKNYYFFIIILLCILYYITLLINKGLSGTVTAGSDLRPTDQTKWTTLLPVGPTDWTTWSFLLINWSDYEDFYSCYSDWSSLHRTVKNLAFAVVRVKQALPNKSCCR